MFGMMEAMLGFLRRQVGLRTDSASTSGSLHAKVAYANNKLDSAIYGTPFHLKTPTFTSGGLQTNSTAPLSNLIDITGPRIILSTIVSIRYYNISSTTGPQVKVYIDASEVYSGELRLNYVDFGKGIVHTYIQNVDDYIYGFISFNGPFRINSSFSIKVRAGRTDHTAGFGGLTVHLPV